MIKSFIAICAIIIAFFTACSTGSYTVSGGKDDKSAICIVADSSYLVELVVDGQKYSVETIREKTWRKDRSIKKTAKNHIVVTPGKHEVSVSRNGNTLYSKTIFVSTTETKFIEL